MYVLSGHKKWQGRSHGTQCFGALIPGDQNPRRHCVLRVVRHTQCRYRCVEKHGFGNDVVFRTSTFAVWKGHNGQVREPRHARGRQTCIRHGRNSRARRPADIRPTQPGFDHFFERIGFLLRFLDRALDDYGARACLEITGLCSVDTDAQYIQMRVIRRADGFGARQRSFSNTSIGYRCENCFEGHSQSPLIAFFLNTQAHLHIL